MPKKQKEGLSAPQLRIVLLCTIVLIFCAAAVGFWYFRSGLIDYSKQVQEDNAKAAVSSSDVSTLKTLKQELEDNKVAVTRTKNIVADSQHYQYQNQIIEDITSYAKKAKVSLGGFTFNSDTASSSTSGAAAAGSAVTTPAPAGLKSVNVSVDIKSPVSYQSLIKFIHYIEVNLTKMQVAGISMAKIADSDTDVTANPITLEVYTR